MVEGLEQELEGITDSGDFAAYQVHDLFVQMSTSQDMLTDHSFPDDFASFQEFLTNYSGTLLHPNHFLLTTARRNLIQFLCYRSISSTFTFIANLLLLLLPITFTFDQED